MADEPQQIRGINWRDTFPFTHLFRAFRIAVHPSKLMLGLIALLALYAGGRLLDGLWAPRHLAVPGEVYEYERLVEKGGNSAQFAALRTSRRDQIEARYADLLTDLKIETDEARARDAARDGRRLRDVKSKILLARQDSENRVRTDYSNRIAAAKNIGDRGQREEVEHEAAAARDSELRGIYRRAYEDLREAKEVRGVGLFTSFFNYQAECVVGVVMAVINGDWIDAGGARADAGADRGGSTRGSVVENIKNFFIVGPMWLMRHHPLYFVLFTLLFLTVWAIFGGAIARIAAVHVARDEKLSVRAALAFSLGKFLSFVSAPLIPLVIVLIVGVVPLLAGALSSLPYGIGAVFNILMGLLFILILAAGFVMTLVLLGTFGGFNLMYPTIAVEGSDSFDAISRSFSYVYARPWRMLLYTLVAIIYGALCYLFVRLFIWLMLSLTHHFVGAGMWADAPSQDALWPTMWRGPSAPPGRLSYDVDFLTLRWDQDIAAGLLAFWVYLAVGMLGAFAISFYFTVNTIIYYLMRHEVDATEMDDVYLEQSEEDFADATAPPASASAVAAASAW